MSTVTVEETKQYVVIDDGGVDTTLEIVEQNVGVIEVGIQGPAGTSGGDDKYYEFNLTNQTDVTVTHNLGKYPSVTVFDSAGDEVEGEYQYLNINQTRLLFSAGFSGKAIFN